MATHLVTGASRGIGLELTRQLAARGDRVLAVVRRSRAALEALEGVQIYEGVDVTDEGAIAGLSERLNGERIDTLIHNSGILTRETLDDLNPDAIRAQFEVNALGPLRLTVALLGHLREGSKIAIVTSRMGSITDNTSGSRYGYRMSKAAVNMAGVSLARDLAGSGIAVALLHPGFVRTDMTGGNGLIDTSESAEGLLARIDELSMETSGGFWHTNGDLLPW